MSRKDYATPEAKGVPGMQPSLMIDTPMCALHLCEIRGLSLTEMLASSMNWYMVSMALEFN